LDKILNATYPGKSHSVTDEITNSIAVIGENINLRRAEFLEVSEGVVASYIHNAITDNLGKIGVLVALESKADQSKLSELGKKLAMHIAAMNPEALTTAEVDPAKVAREKEIFSEQALKSGKPESIVEKMVEGRIRKYYEEVVLLEQVFVMDNKSRISEVLANEAKTLGSPITLKAFIRFELGDGIELEKKDFASEVASLAG
jgi:elongation factor Ts